MPLTKMTYPLLQTNKTYQRPQQTILVHFATLVEIVFNSKRIILNFMLIVFLLLMTLQIAVMH